MFTLLVPMKTGMYTLQFAYLLFLICWWHNSRSIFRILCNTMLLISGDIG